MSKPIAIFDCEIYVNYFLAAFLNPLTGNVTNFEMYEDHPLDVDGIRRILANYTVVGFNSNNFDIPILTYALKGATCAELKECCDFIILQRAQPWNCENHFGFKISSKIDSIDLFAVAPGKGSLKAYGGRLHSKTIQDLPIDPSSSISPAQRVELATYCKNDLQTTLDLYNALKSQIALREEMGKLYGLELRSKSDAQIAEAVMKSEVEKLKKFKIEKPETNIKPFRYKPPAFLSFETERLQRLFDLVTSWVFTVNESGKVLLPKEISEFEIILGESKYKMGIGGLHSQEESTHYGASEYVGIADFDVSSYYPHLILRSGMYPPSMGKEFLSVYGKIVEARIKDKHAGNKIGAETKKIICNSTFGHFSNRYSCLYSPALTIQVTLTGQLALLMLIEKLELAGITVTSANTDGVVIYYDIDNRKTAESIIAWWELVTELDLEEIQYSATYNRDVNNYINFKTSGGVKSKGAYAPPGLQKNPTNQVCVDAVITYLQTGENLAMTIYDCKDIRKFVNTRQVTGGAVKGGVYLGKVVRFYYSVMAEGCISYKVNNRKVADSDGAMPLMTLPDELPDDIDYEFYVAEANKILKEIGAV